MHLFTPHINLSLSLEDGGAITHSDRDGNASFDDDGGAWNPSSSSTLRRIRAVTPIPYHLVHAAWYYYLRINQQHALLSAAMVDGWWKSGRNQVNSKLGVQSWHRAHCWGSIATPGRKDDRQTSIWTFVLAGSSKLGFETSNLGSKFLPGSTASEIFPGHSWTVQNLHTRGVISEECSDYCRLSCALPSTMSIITSRSLFQFHWWMECCKRQRDMELFLSIIESNNWQANR